MNLENYTSLQGPLAETFPKLVPSSILHADELTTLRRDNKELRNQWFYTADGAVYTVEDNPCQHCGKSDKGNVILYLTRGKDNPIFKNIEEACQQLIHKHNYFPNQADLEVVIDEFNKDVEAFDLSELDLEEYNNEFSRFRINIKKYDKLNIDQLRLVERVYGLGEDLEQNMKMFRDAGIKETRIYVLNPDHVRKTLQQKEAPALARAGWFYDFYNVSSFYANVRYVGVANGRLFGVVKTPQARTENSSQHAGPYRTPGTLPSLENDVIIALDRGKAFEYKGTLYVPIVKDSNLKLEK